MQDYQKKFKVKIGFSDHTLGNVASMAATALRDQGYREAYNFK